MDVLLGLQWGDEGKGKIVDFLANRYQVIARFQGGPNAGHTLKVDSVKYVLHQIPSGILHTSIQNIIGNGVVLDPVVFKTEIESLKQHSAGITNRLLISKKAHLILPTHKLLDKAYEQAKGESKIGSTLKGIGPCYQDKIGRQGIRVGDSIGVEFRQRYERLVVHHQSILKFYNTTVELKEVEEEFFNSIDFLKQFQLVDSEYVINSYLDQGSRVLAEGAQGSLLDIDMGSYPFVTSSTTVAAGACSGLGVSPRRIKNVFGILKAYATRVGSGPFPTELFDEDGEKLRTFGYEFGSTTGRARRCGWLDLPALKYTVMLNGVTELFLMKVDVLTHFSTIRVCTHYKTNSGERIDRIPFDMNSENLVPVFKDFPSWKLATDRISSFNDLPKELQTYIRFIEHELGVPITLVSYGPEREATVVKS